MLYLGLMVLLTGIQMKTYRSLVAGGSTAVTDRYTLGSTDVQGQGGSTEITDRYKGVVL